MENTLDYDIDSAIRTVGSLFPDIAAEAKRRLHHNLITGEETGQPKDKVKWSAMVLLKSDFPEQRWIIDGYLPVGLSFLAGRPKVGKSWLGMQFSKQASGAGMKVLYIALEDSPRRVKDRMTLQGFTKANESLDVVFEMPPLSDGGFEWLQEEYEANAYQLIIIDTFSRASNGLDDIQDMGEMTAVVGRLQKFATKENIAILILDHHKKASSMGNNPIDDIIGSTGKAAVCDCALGLYKEAGKGGASLKIIGRDVEEREEALSWDGENYCWKFEGNSYQFRMDSEKGRVYEAACGLVRDGLVPSATEIARITGMQYSNVHSCIQVLIRDGHMQKGEKQGVSQPYYPIEGITL